MTLPGTDYELKTTFWNDFGIADHFGADAVQDTYERVMKEWKDNYVYLTELVMVLNHRCWGWHERNDELCKMYQALYWQAVEYAETNLKGDELSYYFTVTD